MIQQPHRSRWAGQIILALGLVLGLSAPFSGAHSKLFTGSPAALAAGEADGPVGLFSSAADCLSINSGPGAAVNSVQLNWSGTAQGARVVLHVAGADAAQPVWVNGQLVGRVPASAQGADNTPCGLGQTVYLDFAPGLLRQGQNQIEIGDTGLPGDVWSAANARLEVLGPVQAAQAQFLSGPQSPAVTTQVVSFSNHLDSSIQQAIIQLPTNYSVSNGPVPLVIYAHSRYGDMTEGVDVLGPAANTRNWLLATPQLHGHWPGTPSSPIPTPPGIFAYASLESQYDIVSTLRYMLNRPGTYNVDRSRVYVVGYSMGGQLAPIMGAKYPDIFAAVFDNKGPSDFVEWYNEQSALPDHSQQTTAMRQECYTGSSSSPTPQPPNGNLFCYHRRSSVNFANNLLHVPISMTHSFDDLEVPITHSIQLRDAINSFGPDRTARVFVDTTQGPACSGAYHHCYNPDPSAVLTFLQAFTLHGSQNHINIISDESKSYYWLNIAQSGGDHWSYVEATANLAAHSVTLVVTDNKSLSLGLNLGANPIQDWAGLSHPGLGLPAGTYHVQGAGLNTNMFYTSGYLTLALPVTNQAVITITPTDFTVHTIYLPAILK